MTPLGTGKVSCGNASVVSLCANAGAAAKREPINARACGLNLLIPRFTQAPTSKSEGYSRSQKRKRRCYLIVAFTVMTDVPEAVGPLPVALMTKLSLPLYLAFAVYW